MKCPKEIISGGITTHRPKRVTAHFSSLFVETIPNPLERYRRWVWRRTIATLHLMCGLPCAGKTTLAKQIEHERSALRLTPDEWIIRLFGADLSLETLDAARDPVETVLWDLAARLLVLGVDVILDFGFWSRAERDDFRSRAAQLGARSELHFVDVSEKELLARLAARNAQLPTGTFWIDQARLSLWSRQFEPPTMDELRKHKEEG
ncbi:MAG TPA: ATP-binding protein [Pyrinomonadaceae bacterium]|nr:ATP-binding protein [Pyrinomonadaceae bacterium]